MFFVAGSKAFIFMRKALQVLTCEIKKALAVFGSQDLHIAAGSKASIFVRKTLYIRPRDQKAIAFLARREGYTFFDEDDVCGRLMKLWLMKLWLMKLWLMKLCADSAEKVLAI